MLGEPPAPEGGAPGKAAIGLLRGLLAHGLDVAAVAARAPWAHPGAVPPDLPVEEVTVAAESPWRGRWSALVRPEDVLGRGRFGARVRELAAGADVVHLDAVETGWCSRGLATPAAVHLHYRQRLDRDLGPPWTRRFRHDLGFVRAERAALARHRWAMATSPVVAASIRRAAPGVEVVEARMTLDPELYQRAPLDGPPVAGLIGTAAWGPTATATARLLERIWPAVHRRLPEARLRLAGRGIDRLAGSVPAGAEVVGEVASAAEFLRGLSLLLYPLDRGSGVKVKVLEAVATGVPVVTTTPGAEGVVVGDGLVVADDDDGIVAAAAAILADGAERAERGAAAWAGFRREHAPAVAVEPVVELYRRMAAG